MHKRCALLILSAVFFLSAGNAFAQTQGEVKEEKIDRSLELRKLEKRPYAFKLSSSVGMFFGYDSNVRLTPERKGDSLQEILYSLNFSKPFNKNLRFTFNYDLDYINYSEVTDGSNLLNHLRFGLHNKFNKYFTAGTGYDLSIFYYPRNEEGDFLFHKGFFYLKNYLLKNLYHQILVEYGYKKHNHRKALDDTIATYQDKELENKRQSIEYSIGAGLARDLLATLRAKFYKNDANARYMDFYDYEAYEISPSINYRLTKKLDLLAKFVYMEKIYKSRLVTNQTYKQKDDFYAASAGLRYTVNKNNLASLLYTYRDNSSNDPLEKYNENVITCGWQYNF